jgi:hypothetical protein
VIATALVDDLAAESARRGQRLLLVAGWHPGARSADLEPVRARARATGVELLDLEPLLRADIAARRDWSHLFIAAGPREPGHMTPHGNERVAAAIADRLRIPAGPRTR